MLIVIFHPRLSTHLVLALSVAFVVVPSIAAGPSWSHRRIASSAMERRWKCGAWFFFWANMTILSEQTWRFSHFEVRSDFPYIFEVRSDFPYIQVQQTSCWFHGWPCRIKLNTSKSFLQTNGLDIRWFDGPKYWQRHLIGTHVDPPIKSPKKFLGTQITKELMTYINEGLLSRNKLLQHGIIGNNNGITSHPQGIDTPKKDVMNQNSPHLTHGVFFCH